MNSTKDNCPSCNVSLIGDDIPEDQKQYHSPPYKWRREIGIEVPELYDGISYWKCPDCKYVWKALPWAPDFK